MCTARVWTHGAARDRARLWPGAFGYVHFLVTSRRCQSSRVAGVTIRSSRRCLGSSGERGTVSPVRLRPGDLPTQYRDLMAQHQDFRGLGGVTARQEHQPTAQPDH
jgi:hypothetical protein